MGVYGHQSGSITHIGTGGKLWNSIPPKYGLLPCPNCYAAVKPSPGPVLWYVGSTEANHGWRVICQACGALYGQLQQTEQEAVNTWNIQKRNSQ